MDGEPHPDKWSSRAGDPPWIPVAHAIISLTGAFLEKLHSRTNEEFMRKAILLLYESEYYDKILGVAREWVVALTLKNKAGKGLVGVGSEEWEEAQKVLSGESWFEKARQLRNKLQHGRISREENAAVKLGQGDIEICTKSRDKCRPLKVIRKAEVESTAKDIIDNIEKLSKEGGE